MADSHLIIEHRNGMGIITLNRPEALNALTHGMIRGISEALTAWQNSPEIRMVVFRGAGGKAFCAGGDIKQTWINRSDVLLNDHYFYDEYSMNRQLYHYSRPLIALMDGITMGGGYGVAGYCDYKIATENTRWAMPETGIGFFPDIGVSHELQNMPGATGLFLALTGMTIGPEDARYCGMATHYMYAGALPDLMKALEEGADHPRITIERLSKIPALVGPVVQHQDIIDHCFAQESVADILDALEREHSDWALSVRALLRTRSPLSLRVTFERMKRAKGQSFDRIIEDDYVIARQFMRGAEFFEGVRAMLVDKDKKPKWGPETLDKVTETAVLRHFEPLPGTLAEGFKG